MTLALRYGALLLLLVMATSAVAAEQDPARIILADVRIVDVRAGTVIGPMDVELDGPRIASVRTAGSERPSAAKVFEGRGRFVVPGFWDMHAHVNSIYGPEQWMFPLLVANGVTGVRDMKGDCFTPGCPDDIHFMRSLQARVADGSVLGPRIVAVGSWLVNGPRSRVDDKNVPSWALPGTASESRMLVQQLESRRVDFIKPYETLPREAYFELLVAASAAGMRLSGHVPMAVSTLEAVQAGQLSIEHARNPVFDCSRYADELHQIFARWTAGESPLIYSGYAQVSRGDRDAGSFYKKVLSSYDESRCARTIAGFAASRAWYVPTHITRRFEALADEEAFLNDPRLSLVPVARQQKWKRQSDDYRKRFSAAPDEKRAYVEFYELGLRVTGRMHVAGVPVLVGTDTPDSYCFPGSSFHDELMELRKAGLSNAAILRAATLSAAEFMGREAQFGTVERGKTADLVILSADPLVDIANTRRIEAVVLNGKLLEREGLRSLQRSAAHAAQTMQ